MQRPASATVLGILNIVFGSLLCLCAPFALIGSILPSQPGAIPSLGGFEQFLEIAEKSQTPAVRAWLAVHAGLSIFASVALIAAGIGLLGTRRWGRTLSIGWAVYGMVGGVVDFVIQLFLGALPAMREVGGGGPETLPAAAGLVLGAGLGACCTILYPVILFLFMTRASFVAAYGSAASARPAPAPPESWDAPPPGWAPQPPPPAPETPGGAPGGNGEGGPPPPPGP